MGRLDIKAEHKQVMTAIRDRELDSTDAIAVRTGLPEYRVRQIIAFFIEFDKVSEDDVKHIGGIE